jgi:hypothetical protein
MVYSHHIILYAYQLGDFSQVMIHKMLNMGSFISCNYIKITRDSEIPGSHSSECEDKCLLGCCAV